MNEYRVVRSLEVEWRTRRHNVLFLITLLLCLLHGLQNDLERMKL